MPVRQQQDGHDGSHENRQRGKAQGEGRRAEHAIDPLNIMFSPMPRHISVDRRRHSHVHELEISDQSPRKIPHTQHFLAELVIDHARHDEARQEEYHLPAPGEQDVRHQPRAARAILRDRGLLDRFLGCCSRFHYSYPYFRFIAPATSSNIAKSSFVNAVRQRSSNRMSEPDFNRISLPRTCWVLARKSRTTRPGSSPRKSQSSHNVSRGCRQSCSYCKCFCCEAGKSASTRSAPSLFRRQPSAAAATVSCRVARLRPWPSMLLVTARPSRTSRMTLIFSSGLRRRNFKCTAIFDESITSFTPVNSCKTRTRATLRACTCCKCGRQSDDNESATVRAASSNGPRGNGSSKRATYLLLES